MINLHFSYGLALLLHASMAEFDRNGGHLPAAWVVTKCQEIAQRAPMPPAFSRDVFVEVLAQIASYFEMYEEAIDETLTWDAFLCGLCSLDSSATLTPLDVIAMEGR